MSRFCCRAVGFRRACSSTVQPLRKTRWESVASACSNASECRWFGSSSKGDRPEKLRKEIENLRAKLQEKEGELYEVLGVRVETEGTHGSSSNGKDDGRDCKETTTSQESSSLSNIHSFQPRIAYSNDKLKAQWVRINKQLRDKYPSMFERIGKFDIGRRHLEFVESFHEPLPAVPKPPKYPIMLCHGMGGDKPKLEYFLGVKADLESVGCRVYQPKVARYAEIEERAKQLRDAVHRAVQDIRLQTNAAPGDPIKMNLIAHSMGGLDARYFISHLGGHEYVASLTTLGTPHHGSSYADWWMQDGGGTFIGRQLRKLNVSIARASDNLTTMFTRENFNPNTPLHPDVVFLSLGGKGQNLSFVFTFSHRIIQKREGPNDGLVSVESSKFGEYLGTLPLDHADMINWSLKYDARGLYRELVNELVRRGL